VALVPLLLVKAFIRTRFTLITLATYAGCLIAVLSHLLLDWTNVYGVRLMLPFSAKWYRLDSTDIIDPVILGVLILALAAPALSALITSEMGGRKSSGPGRGWAWFALATVLLYDTGRWMAHDRAISIVDAYSYRGAPAERVSVFPVRFTIMRWRAVVQGDGFIYEVPIDLSRDFDAAGGHTEYPPSPRPPSTRLEPRAPSRHLKASTSFPSGRCCRWTIHARRAAGSTLRIDTASWIRGRRVRRTRRPRRPRLLQLRRSTAVGTPN
jgi:inner membrane protein